jgi:MFS family permease
LGAGGTERSRPQEKSNRSSRASLFASRSVSAYVSKRASAQEKGATLGASQSMASLARMFGPAMGGFLYGHVGPRSPYWAAATGMSLALLIALTLPTKSPTTPPAPAEA